MKLTDEQIDKLFQDSASKQSFAYKPEYWEEFSASLSDNAPLSEASDDALDAAFQEGAANQSFEYKPEFWEEFSASLPNNTPLSQVSDEALDAAFQNDASNISVDYKPEFWSEFSDELSSVVATENVSDAEVDALYREEASKLSFVYHPSYWEEMAAMLRRRRRRPEFLWFGLSGVFTTAIIAMLFVQQSPLSVPTPEIALNGLNAVEQNTNRGTTNGTNTSGKNVFQNVNDSHNGNIANAANVANNNTNSTNGVNPANNGNVANNGNNPNGANGTNNPQANLNNPRVTPRVNRVTPNLVLTALNNASTRNGASSENTTTEDAANDMTLDPLASKSLGTLMAFNNELEDAYSELPQLRPYKGGWMTSMYVQGVGGISESMVSSSKSMSSSYGIGAGVQIMKDRWAFNLGSNVLIENHTELSATKISKTYERFGSQELRQTADYSNIYKVELDLGVGYNIGRNQIRFGVRPSFIYNALSDYHEFVYDTRTTEIVTSKYRSDNVYGYVNSMNQWGIKPTLGYAYTFPGNWTMGLSLGTELVPMFSHAYLVESTNAILPIDGQLYLRKTLNFKK